MDDCTALRYSLAVVFAPAESVLRVDRFALPSPERREDGSWLYSAYLAHADRHLQYGGGRVEVATEQALNNDAYLKALRGLSVVDERQHRPDRPVDTSKGSKPVGVVVDARWDPKARAVAVEFVVFDPAANDAIRSRKTPQLSEGYYPTWGQVRADGAVEQVARRPQHISIVRAGRDDRADIQTDGGAMTPEQIAELRAGLLADLKTVLHTDKADAALTAEKQRADKAESDLATLRASLGLRTDAKTVDLDAVVSDRVQADAALLERAKALGVRLPETSRPATRAKDLAIALGADRVQVDAADGDAYARGVIAAAQPRAAARHAAGVQQRPAGASTPIRQS